MRIARSIITLLLVRRGSVGADRHRRNRRRKATRSSFEAVSAGSAVEQADLLIEDAEGDTKQNDQVPALTYRLQGDKSVVKELKDKHDRMVVQVKGILRSELSQSGIGTTVGRTRITIGADPRNPTHGAEQPLPVLEAKSFEATTVSCGK